MSARAEPLISFPRSYRPRRTLTARLESRRRDQNLTIEGHRWGYGSFRIQHRDFNAWNLLKRKGLMNFLKKIWVFHMGGGFDFCVWNCSLEKKIWRKDVGKVPSKKLVFFFFWKKSNLKGGALLRGISVVLFKIVYNIIFIISSNLSLILINF